MKRVIDTAPQQDNYKVYNKEVVFKVEQYDLLSMMFLVFDITPVAPSGYVLPTSPYIIENVILESNGVPIARVNTNYTLSRIDRSNANLFDQMNTACSLTGTFSLQKTITMPLFFWTFDNQEIDTRRYPNLQVRVFTKSSKELMGFTQEIIGLDIKLRQVFSQRGLYGYDDVQETKPLQLEKAYNFYQAQNYSLAEIADNTPTVIRQTLNVPYKTKNLCFMIRLDANAQTKGNITQIVLTRNNGIRNVYDSLTNYFLNKTAGENDGNVFNITYDEIHPNAGLLLNQNHSPVIVEITYSYGVRTTRGTSTLYVGYEYNSNVIEQKNIVDDGYSLIELNENKF